jgi:hypothetical protein
MKRKEIDLFEKIYSQVESLHNEISALSKKAPNDGINKFKLRFINKILEEANKLVKDKYKPFADFQSFDEDELPTNSDVIMILAQYINCMEKLRADNVELNFGQWYWTIDGKQSGIKTSPPKKISKDRKW